MSRSSFKSALIAGLKRISCKGHAEYLSRSMDETLCWWERLAMRFHGSLCKSCKKHEQQLEVVERKRRELWDGENESIGSMDEEARQRIMENLNNSCAMSEAGK